MPKKIPDSLWPAHYWSHVLPANSKGCRLWNGRLDAWGYGMIWRHGKDVRAHRMAWEMANGPIPDGMLACHTCDTPNCCTVSHLFIGTNLDNSRDKIAKGRGRWSSGPSHWTKKNRHLFQGEKNHHAAHTASSVLKIRAEYAKGSFSLSQLAKKYGCSKHNIWMIIKRKAWAHI